MNKNLLILLLIITLGFGVRTYEFVDRFYYTHDSDLASWIYKDMVIDNHFRIVGQLTTSPGIFIGPFFYYLLVPLYMIGKSDPLFTISAPWFIYLASVISIFVFFTKLSGKKSGLIGAFIFSLSYGISQNDREVVPTTPVYLWSIWFFYYINKLFQKDTKAIYVLAILWSLIWHLNLALALLSPLIILGIIKLGRKIRFKDMVIPTLLFLILSAPLLLFEARHGFQQLNALTNTLSSISNSDQVSHYSKLKRTISVIAWNASQLYVQFPRNNFSLNLFVIPIFLLAIFIFLLQSKLLPFYSGYLYPLWIVLYVIFFSLHPINISEYYVNGQNIIWIFIFAVFLSNIKTKVSILVLVLFSGLNIGYLLLQPANQNNYINRKKIIWEIKKDSQIHNYPCVSISYITDPGYNLGYRYLIWLVNLKTKPVSSIIPVYTIVYPQSKVSGFDVSFGSLGLILPDRQKYQVDSLANACQGDNHNLVDSMFGFTN